MRRPAVLREKLQAPRHMCRQGVRVMAFRDEPSRPEFVAKKTRALYHKLHDRPKVFAEFSTRSQLMRGLLQSLPRWPTSQSDSAAASTMRGSQVTIKTPAQQQQ